MKNTQGIKIRLTLTVSYALGFLLGMQSKSWWALPISLVATFVVSFLIFFFLRLMKIYGIGQVKEQDLSRQQRRALARLKNNNEH
jgi:uncharacterized membrane protein